VRYAAPSNVLGREWGGASTSGVFYDATSFALLIFTF
jgi:hypothetical protein